MIVLNVWKWQANIDMQSHKGIGEHTVGNTIIEISIKSDHFKHYKV